MERPEINPQDWEWLKSKCADYAESPEAGRAKIIEQAGGERPDLVSALQQMILDYHQSGDTGITSWVDTWWFEDHRPSSPTFVPGEVISDRYTVKSYIGRGGMGEVYEVVDTTLPNRRSVALKIIRSDMAGSRDATARFEREVQNSLTVTHPNVCRIYDVGRHRKAASAVLYLTMEYLPGLTLAKWMRDRDVILHPLSEAEALPLLRQLAAGLAAIHAAGVIHRDFKPANVILSAEDESLRAVITDFGLSRNSSIIKDGETQTGMAVGTLAWMAPEQFSGQVRLTSAVDVYALGVTIYELLTGVRITPGAPLTALAKAPVSPWLRGIVRACLDPDLTKRFAGAEAVVKALDTPQLAVDPPAASPRKLPLAAVAALGLLLIVAALTAFFWRSGPRNRAPAERDLLQRAARQLYSNSFYEGSRLLEQSVRTAPHDSFPHALLAYAYDRLDLTGKANRELIKAMAEDDLGLASSDERLFVGAMRLTMARDYGPAAAAFRRYYNAGDRTARPDRAILLGHALESAGKPDEASKVYESAGPRGAARLALAILDARRSRIAAAKAEFEEAAKAFQAAGQLSALAAVQLQFGAALNQWGSLPEAKARLQSCTRQAETIGDAYDGILCRLQSGNVAIQEARTDGDLAAIQRVFQVGIDEAGRLGFQLLAGQACLSFGRVDVLRGDYNAADRHFREARTRAESEESLRLQAQIDQVSADAHNRSGHAVEGEREVRAALEFYRSGRMETEAAECTLVLSQSLRNQGRLTEALSVLESPDAARVALSGPGQFRLQYAIATVYHAQENEPAALSHFQDAMHSGGPANEVRSLIAIARVQAGLGELAQAGQAMEKLARRRDLSSVQRSELHRVAAARELFAGVPAMAERALANEPGPDAMVLRGLAAIRHGKIPDGLSLCRSALDAGGLPPADSAARLCLLEGMAAHHDLPSARAIYESIGRAWTPQVESAWRADAIMCALEPANEALRRSASAHLEDLRRSWGDAAFRLYLGRVDVARQMSVSNLHRLAKESS